MRPRPRRPAGRRVRRVRRGVVALSLVLLGVAAAAAYRKRAGIARRAGVLLAGGSAGLTSVAAAARPPARLACAPAVTPARPGEQRAVERLADSDRASVLVLWARGGGDESTRLQSAATRSGAQVVPLASAPRALVVTTTGATVRTLRREAPSATWQLAVGGTRELCVVVR